MDLMTAIRGRRSVRRFQEKPVPESVLADLVESLLWAPSAGNLQSRRFLFISAPALIRELAAASNQEFVATAPLVLVGCADHRIRKDYGSRGVELYSPQDVALSVQNYMLAAHSLGLATTWVGAFNEQAVRKLLDLPHHLRPVVMAPTGYGAEKPAPPARRPADDAVEFHR